MVGLHIHTRRRALVPHGVVGRCAHRVVQDRAAIVLPDGVQQLVGGVERAGGTHVGVGHPGDDRCRTRCAGESGHLEVAEPVIGEAGLVGLGPARAGQDVAVGRGRVTVGGGVDGAVVGEVLGRLHPDGRAPGAGHLQPLPAGDVLAEVVHEHSRPRLGDTHRAQGLHHVHHRHRAGHQGRPGCRDRGHRLPARGVIARLIPPGPVDAGVVGLAVVDVVRDDRTGGPAPALRAGGEVLPAPIGVGDRDQPDRLLGAEPAEAVRAEAGTVPAPEPDPDRVGAAAQGRGDVVGLVQGALLVRGAARGQPVVADHAAVDVQLVEPQTGHVGAGRANRAGQCERAAQHRRGRAVVQQGDATAGVQPAPRPPGCPGSSGRGRRRSRR